MDVNIIELSIPIFFGFIGLEILLTYLFRKPFFRLNDSINDLSCGIVKQVTEIFLKFAIVGVYIYVYQNFSLGKLNPALTIPNTWVWWVIAFFAWDFLYYWFHRKSHEVGIIWASHVVHHSSEEYNLTVALRQSSFQGLFSMWFYLPMAFLGFTPEMFVIVSGINLLYQFVIHTRSVPKLGVLEYVMNTPSHHRVHHGKNPKYIDKNHAGVFIIWDRMFGTFQEEEEEPVYGITKPLASWNPVWANVHTFAELFEEMGRARGITDKLKVLFMPPGWRPDYNGGPVRVPDVHAETYQKYDPEVSTPVKVYALAQFILVLLVAVKTLEYAHHGSPLVTAGLVFLIILSLTNIGTMLENKRWAYFSEFGRILTVSLIGFVATYQTEFQLAGGIISISFLIISGISLGWLWKQESIQLKLA